MNTLQIATLLFPRVLDDRKLSDLAHLLSHISLYDLLHRGVGIGLCEFSQRGQPLSDRGGRGPCRLLRRLETLRDVSRGEVLVEAHGHAAAVAVTSDNDVLDAELENGVCEDRDPVRIIWKHLTSDGRQL